MSLQLRSLCFIQQQIHFKSFNLLCSCAWTEAPAQESVLWSLLVPILVGLFVPTGFVPTGLVPTRFVWSLTEVFQMQEGDYKIATATLNLRLFNGSKFK